MGFIPFLPFVGAFFMFGLMWLAGDSLTTSQLERNGAFSPRREIGDLLLRGRIPADRIRQVTLVRFPAGSYSRHQWNHWLYDYTGFPKTEIEKRHLRDLVQAIGESEPFLSTDRLEVERVRAAGSGEKVVQEMAQRAQWTAAHEQTEEMALKLEQAGALQFKLRDGKEAFLFVWLSGGKAYLEAPYKYASLRGVSSKAGAVLAEAWPMARVRDLPVLFRNLTVEGANKRAGQKFGDIYRQSLDFVASAPEVRDAVGDVVEVRPARGANAVFTWMDQSARFTFAITGKKGRAAAVVWREGSPNNCIAGELAVEGKVREIPQQELVWRW